MVKGIDQFGSLALSDVMVDAIAHAEKGHYLIEGEARRMKNVNEQLNEFSGTRYYFTNTDGAPIQSGKLLIQNDLSKVLTETAASPRKDCFYWGFSELHAYRSENFKIHIKNG